MADNICVTLTPISGLVIVRSQRFFDDRGFFTQAYSKQGFAKAGIGIEFVQDNLSFNKYPNTLRGLHFQTEPFAQAKLVSVVRGRALDVVVDLRQNSRSFGEHFKFELNALNGDQLFVPEGFAHGFLTREADTLFSYKVSMPYSPEHEAGIRFDDAVLGIDWGTNAEAIIASSKDRDWPAFDSTAGYFR